MQMSLRSSMRPAAARAVSRRSTVKVAATSRVDRCKKTDIMVSPSILSADFSRLGDEVGAG
jgi:ribulose-phosphate 3-epimerase